VTAFIASKEFESDLSSVSLSKEHAAHAPVLSVVIATAVANFLKNI
jgi:hypothetical protein